MGVRIPEMQSGYGPFSPLQHGVEAAGQTYNAGAPLIRSAGKVAIAGDNPAAAAFLGFAVADASGTTDEPVTFNHCPVGAAVVMTLDDDADPAPGTHVLAQADQFVRCGFQIDVTTGRAFLVDSDTGNNVLFDILQFIDDLGTIGGRVLAIRVA